MSKMSVVKTFLISLSNVSSEDVSHKCELGAWDEKLNLFHY